MENEARSLFCGGSQNRVLCGAHRAFTLIELTVVIILIAILAALAAPNLVSSMSSARLDTAARDLLVAARYAHDFAATRRRICRLVIQSEPPAYWLEYQTDPGQQPDQFETLKLGPIKPVTLTGAIEFASIKVETTAPRFGESQLSVIDFRPDGTADAAVIQLAVKDKPRRFSLTITPNTASIALTDGAIDHPPLDREDLDA